MHGVPLAWRQVCFPLGSGMFYAGEAAKGLLWCHGKYQGRSLASGSWICDVKLSVTTGTSWGVLHAGSCSRLVRVQGEATFGVFGLLGTHYFCAEQGGGWKPLVTLGSLPAPVLCGASQAQQDCGEEKSPAPRKARGCYGFVSEDIPAHCPFGAYHVR